MCLLQMIILRPIHGDEPESTDQYDTVINALNESRWSHEITQSEDMSNEQVAADPGDPAFAQASLHDLSHEMSGAGGRLFAVSAG